MAAFDEDHSLDSGQNHINADRLESANEKSNTPPVSVNLSSVKYHSITTETKRRTGFISSILKSLLSFRKYYIQQKVSIANDHSSTIIKQLGVDNIEVIASFLKIAKNSNEYSDVSKKFAEGCKCYALIENSMLALAWVYRKKYRINSGHETLKLRPDEALIEEIILGESVDKSKAIVLEDGITSLLKRQGTKLLVLATHKDNGNLVYSIYRFRFLGLSFSRIRANPGLTPLGFR